MYSLPPISTPELGVLQCPVGTPSPHSAGTLRGGHALSGHGAGGGSARGGLVAQDTPAALRLGAVAEPSGEALGLQ